MMKLLFAVFLLMPAITLGQANSDVMMIIDIENTTNYYLDPAESAKWMSTSAPTPLPSPFVTGLKNQLNVGDVVAINGKPAKGTLAVWGFGIGFSNAVTPVPTRPIADINRSNMWHMLFEVHDAEKGQVGTLAAVGFAGGAAPPGTPPGSAYGNFAITGGSGAWSGARGQAATVSFAWRTASVVEDPAYRRVNGAGGIWRIAVTLNSMTLPTLVAAYHSDFTPVSASNPARAGEALVLAVKGLGPTNPVLVPGQTFDEQKLAVVTAPVAVTVNDLPAAVSNQVGWPGTGDTYRVDVALPSGIAAGTASMSVTAAWIPGPEFKIPVR